MQGRMTSARSGQNATVARILLCFVAALMIAGRQVPSPSDPDAGISGALASDRASRVSDLRYTLSFVIPAALGGTNRRARRDPVRAGGCRPSPAARLRRASRARSQRHRPRPFPDTFALNGHIVLPAAVLVAGDNHVTDRVHRQRRPPESAGRLPLHAVRAGPRARGVPVLRSTRSQSALLARARSAGWVDRHVERPRRGTRIRGWRTDPPPIRRNEAALDVPLRVCGGQVVGGNRRTGRTHVPDVSPRDRHGAARAQPGGHLRPACILARVAGALHRDSVPLRASSTSSSSRRFSSAEWSIPARFTTTPLLCCWSRRLRPTRCSVARASLHTRPPTCGLATS